MYENGDVHNLMYKLRLMTFFLYFRCGEFNILGMTHFASLAAHAIKAR